ncbi:50S ribosomal protein L28 [Buchnera aphidicola (Ceratoglyphina bambusae)]|uniref:50S ribosomal protein L28 n=1 Tax=Buchnera aphidicola TaxID=9 RepID=UPI0031B8A8A9
MSKICQITKKKTMFGNKRSHAMNSTKRMFKANIQKHKFWIPKIKKFIKIKISSKGIREINKKGIDYIFKKYFKK